MATSSDLTSEDKARIISEVMEEYKVTPRQIPYELPFNIREIESISRKSHRYFKVKGFAWFRSHNACARSWPSAHAWCVIDLKEQTVCYEFKQDCQSCDEAVTPEYDSDVFREMVEFAVKLYLKRTGRMPYDDLAERFERLDIGEDDRGPHDEGRCEVCKLLGHSCWKK